MPNGVKETQKDEGPDRGHLDRRLTGQPHPQAAC